MKSLRTKFNYKNFSQFRETSHFKSEAIKQDITTKIETCKTSEDNFKNFVNSSTITLIKGIFMICDAISFVPNKIIKSDLQKIKKCQTIKARSVILNDFASPWRNLETIDNQLSFEPFTDCKNLYHIWESALKKDKNKEIMGTRDVLEIIDSEPTSKVKLGSFKWYSYEEIENDINKIVNFFIQNNVKKGDKIVIFAETRKEWMVTALACFKFGLPIVTVYSTLGREALAHAINETKGKYLFTSEDQLSKLEVISDKINSISKIVYFKNHFSKKKLDVNRLKNIECVKYDNIISVTAFKDKIVNNFKSNVDKNDPAVIMYTSGTSGNPKGTVLTHQNLIAALSGINSYSDLDGFLGKSCKVIAAYLPLAHIFQLIVDIQCLSSGIKIGYCTPHTLIKGSLKLHSESKSDLEELKPTSLAVVPTVLNKLRFATENKLSNLPYLIQSIINECYQRKTKRYDDGLDTPIMDKLIFQKFKNILGGNLNKILCGGAQLDPETQRFTKMFFSKNVFCGYGLTETCAIATLDHPSTREEGTVGIPLDSVEIILKPWKEGNYFPTLEKPQGEILIHGKNVFNNGYLNTKSDDCFEIINGKRYFCTGDIGEFTKNGNLKIIDRKKDLVKLSHGEYIALGNVESKLISNVYIDNVCLYAKPDRSYTIALIVANKENIEKLAKELQIIGNFKELCQRNVIRRAVVEDIEASMNTILNKYEIPRKVLLFSEPWTSADNLVTDAMKIKREAIEKTFLREINQIYT